MNDENSLGTNPLTIAGRVTLASKKLLDDEVNEDRPVNYKVKGMVHFKDGVLNTRGSALTVKATNAEEAEKLFREVAHKNWKDIQKIEIMSVTKG